METYTQKLYTFNSKGIIILHILHLLSLDKSALVQYNMHCDERLLSPVHSRDARSYFIPSVFADKRTARRGGWYPHSFCCCRLYSDGGDRQNV